MQLNLVETIIGIFGVDDTNEIRVKQIWPNDSKSIINILQRLRKGEADVIDEFLSKISSFESLEVFSNNKLLVNSLNERFKIDYVNFYAETQVIKEKINELAVEYGFIKKKSDYGYFSHNILNQLTRFDVHKKLSVREVVLTPAVQLLVDLDTTLNSLTGRMREWYGVYFPEMSLRVKDHKDYARIISKLGYRDKITSKSLMEMSIKKKNAEKIEKVAESSIGATFYEADMVILSKYANRILDLYNFREQLVNYISMVSEEVAPNLAYIAGPIIGAKLIEKAGSLKKLGMMSSSKIQVLGAEKAMFRAIKSNAKPPKHGLLYQHPYVNNAPKNKRGSRARTLAAKIAIAARADVFSGNFIAEILVSQIDDYFY